VKKPIACTLLLLLALLLAPLISTALSGPATASQPGVNEPYPISIVTVLYLPLVFNNVSTFVGTEPATPTPGPTPLPTSTIVPYP
jgi:hypothetical protein